MIKNNKWVEYQKDDHINLVPFTDRSILRQSATSNSIYIITDTTLINIYQDSKGSEDASEFSLLLYESIGFYLRTDVRCVIRINDLIKELEKHEN